MRSRNNKMVIRFKSPHELIACEQIAKYAGLAPREWARRALLKEAGAAIKHLQEQADKLEQEKANSGSGPGETNDDSKEVQGMSSDNSTTLANQKDSLDNT